jgi:hypothetical protein
MAIRDRGTRVCILNPEEAACFESTGELPRCNRHPHISKTRADVLTSTMLFVSEGRRHYEAHYVGKGKKAIVFNSGRQWRKMASAGYQTLQLAHGGGAR